MLLQHLSEGLIRILLQLRLMFQYARLELTCFLVHVSIGRLFNVSSTFVVTGSGEPGGAFQGDSLDCCG